MRRVVPALWLSERGVWALLALGLLGAIASLVPALWIAVALSGVVLAAAALADLQAGPRPAALRIVRRKIGAVTLRRPGRITYDIENRGSVGIRLGILESPSATIDFDRDVVVAAVGARATGSVEQTFLARERGVAAFRDSYIWQENMIGLFRRRYRVPGHEDVRVLPDLSAVERYGRVATRKTLLELGLRRMRLRGNGNDFESLREYQPGDAFRVIDWKATARRGRTMVAQYDVERSQTVVVALDCGRLMLPRIASTLGGPQRKFDFALTAGLSVARIADAASDNVGLLAFAAKPVLRIAPRRGAAHAKALALAAYDLQPRPEEPDYESVFADLRARLHKRSLVVLFTDLFDPVTSEAVLAALGGLAPRHLAVCVLVNDGALLGATSAGAIASHEAYRVAVALALAEERAKAIATLRARGIIVVDVPAQHLTVGSIDTYLDIKSRGLL